MNLPERHEVVAELCRRSFYRFLQEFWEVVIKEEPIYNWHIPYLCGELQTIAERVKRREPKQYDLIINIPPGTTKSTITTIMLPVWCWVIDPTLRIITSSYSGGLSTEHSVKSRDIIRSDKFKLLYPHIKLKTDSDNKSNYENTAGGQRIATSVGGTITGKHAHIIIPDDLINPDESLSEVARDNANNHLDRTLSTRKVDKKITPTVLIMQRLHEDDPTGHLLEKKEEGVKHICLPGEVSDDISPPELRENYVDGLLDPIRLDREILDEMRTDLGGFGFAGQVMQTPIPDGGGILKKEWFPIIGKAKYEQLAQNRRVDFWVDSAYTENEKNDPTAIMCTCKVGRELYITNVVSKHMEFPELCNFLPDFVRDNGYTPGSKIKIEPKASGLSIYQQLKRTTRLNVMKARVPKDSKVVRASAIGPTCEAGRVILVEGAWNEPFLAQCQIFPAGKYDDMVDDLSMAVSDFIREKTGYIT